MNKVLFEKMRLSALRLAFKVNSKSNFIMFKVNKTIASLSVHAAKVSIKINLKTFGHFTVLIKNKNSKSNHSVKLIQWHLTKLIFLFLRLKEDFKNFLFLHLFIFEHFINFYNNMLLRNFIP